MTGLTTSVTAADSTQVSLRYGLGNQRLAKELRDAGGKLVSSRRYLFGAGGAPVAEQLTGPAGDSQVCYIHGVGGLVGLIDGDLQAGLVKDRLGSARLLLGDDGEPLGGYDYRPFGDPMARPPVAVPTC